jgi:hypothetical protein
MYNILLILHSWNRWIILLLCLLAIVNAFSAMGAKREFISSDNRISVFFIIAMHTQFLVGLILYFTSPVTRAAFEDFGAAMKNGGLRFFAVEHFALMLLAVILAQVGRSRSKKAANSYAKHKQLAIFYSISLFLMLISIPWPFMQNARPLFRF